MRTPASRFLLSGALVSLLGACGGTIQDTGKEELVDADQDGSFSDEDCNDADPAVRPRAPDQWYDGVDSDCGGNDDFDADADGTRSAAYGGGDCDDTDTEVNPLAEETWYDGIDQDCAADDDNDADGDGEAAVAFGGEDCDDELAAVRPGADEVWYDGVDQDCAGDDDFDADADSFVSAAEDGDDCDDFDADVFPGAVEIWYDGIDQDCLEDDDFDADGDGYQTLDAGGEDCDDTDPAVQPHTVELLDGEDSNCDGRTDQLTVEEDVGSWYIHGTYEGGGFGASVSVGEFSGDDALDLAVLQTTTPVVNFGDAPFGAVYIWDTAGLSGSTVADTADAIIRSTESTGPLERVRFLGDVGGSPVNRADLAITGTEAEDAEGDVRGAVWIFKNSRLDQVSTSFLVTTWTLWGEEAVTLTDFGFDVAGVPDMDGDGLREVAVGAPARAGGGAVFLYMSATLGPTSDRVEILPESADAIWTGTVNGDQAGWSLAPVEDFDGDGAGDLLIGAPGFQSNAGAVFLMVGDANPVSGSLGSLAQLRLTSTTLGDRAGEAVASGDFDADGAPDIAVGVPRATGRAGKVYVTMNTALATLPSGSSRPLTTLSVVNYGGTANDVFAGSSLAVGGDASGDGRDELFVGGPGVADLGAGSGGSWLIFAPTSGNRALSDVDVAFHGAAAGDGVGNALALGDLNGDGRSDVVVGVPGEDVLSNEGSVVLGFSAWP